ncbi:hypothetical protein BDV12DRAFT_191869 [Aspergillus spectabilis]
MATPTPSVGFEYASHQFLGDHVNLYFPDTRTIVLAETHPLTFPNGVKLTYGQISAFAGDFFATRSPISHPTDPRKRIARFVDAWDTLGNEKSAQQDVDYFLDLLQDEVDAVSEAHAEGKDPAEDVYPSLVSIEK